MFVGVLVHAHMFAFPSAILCSRMVPGLATSLSALALGLGTGSWTLNLLNAYSVEHCPRAEDICVPCSPCVEALQASCPAPAPLVVEPCPAPQLPLCEECRPSIFQVCVIGFLCVNLLVWAFLLGRCSVRGQGTQTRAVVEECVSPPRRFALDDDGDGHIWAARQRAHSLR